MEGVWRGYVSIIKGSSIVIIVAECTVKFIVSSIVISYLITLVLVVHPAVEAPTAHVRKSHMHVFMTIQYMILCKALEPSKHNTDSYMLDRILS